MNIWGSRKQLDHGKQYCAQIGPLLLWLRHHLDEVHIAVEHTDDGSFESESVVFSTVDNNEKEFLEWKRWVVGNSCSTVTFMPALPDRPVVVRPEVEVKIPQGHEALFFVSIPVWVRVIANETKEMVLLEEPSILLSNLWFGDTMSGELCYSMRTKARREIIDSRTKPHRAICPVRIANTTKSQLNVDRFCVNVEYLNVYRGDKRLWTNEVSIKFQGEDAVSKVDYGHGPPEYENADELITKARTSWKKTLLKKSIGTFKLLTGF